MYTFVEGANQLLPETTQKHEFLQYTLSAYEISFYFFLYI